MRVLILLAVALAWVSPANAHGGGEIMLPQEVLTHWHPEPLPVLLPLIVAGLYGFSLVRLWSRAGIGRAVRRWQAGSFGLGLVLFLVALASPLESITGTLLSAHMVQHVILVACAPPLVLIGRPEIVLLYAVPPQWRRSAAFAFQRAARPFRLLVHPIPAALIHAAVMWIWHAPPLFEAALRSYLLHDLEHLSFVVSALLFWQAVLLALRHPDRRLIAIAAVVITLIQGGLLGALLTLAGRVLYPVYGAGPATWSLTALGDQQLAGLIMWVPTGAAYLGVGTAIASRLLRPETRGQHPQRHAAVGNTSEADLRSR